MPAARVERSIVLPCLNEAGTLGVCVRKAQDSVRRLPVADNGSTDGSQDIARANDGQVRLSLTRIGEG